MKKIVRLKTIYAVVRHIIYSYDIYYITCHINLTYVCLKCVDIGLF